MLLSKHKIDDILYKPQKILDIKLITDIFGEYQEYVYNIDGIRYTESQVDKLFILKYEKI